MFRIGQRHACRISAIVLAAGILLAIGPIRGAVGAETIKAKFSSSYQAGTPLDIYLSRFAQLVRDRTDGEVDLTIYRNAQLGSEVDTAEGIRLGSIEAGVVTSSKLVDWIPELGVLDLPFIFDSEDHVLHAYPALMEAFAPKFPESGFRLVAMPLAGVRHLISTFPIKSPEDVQGRKMRVMPNPLHIKVWQLVGANPTPIPAPEIYSALQTGLVDFMDNPKTTYLSFKWHEVAKYYIELGHIVPMHAIVFSEKWWQKLSKKNQDAIYSAAQDLVPLTHHLLIYNDNEALAKTIETGSQVSQVADKEAWRKLMAPIWDEFKASVPDAATLIETIQSAR